MLQAKVARNNSDSGLVDDIFSLLHCQPALEEC